MQILEILNDLLVISELSLDWLSSSPSSSFFLPLAPCPTDQSGPNQSNRPGAGITNMLQHAPCCFFNVLPVLSTCTRVHLFKVVCMQTHTREMCSLVPRHPPGCRGKSCQECPTKGLMGKQT